MNGEIKRYRIIEIAFPPMTMLNEYYLIKQSKNDFIMLKEHCTFNGLFKKNRKQIRYPIPDIIQQSRL